MDEKPDGVASLAGALGAGGRAWEIPVGGSSMRPLIAPGDRVTIVRAAPAGIKTGQILAYWKDSRIVVHRVIARRKSPEGVRFLQVGDGGGEPAWVRGPEVLGKVVRIRKASRSVLLGGLPAGFLNAVLGGLDRVSAAPRLRGKTAAHRLVKAGLVRLIAAAASLYPGIRT